MGWKDYFLAYVSRIESNTHERVVAIDDGMLFDGNTFYHPMTPCQKIFYSNVNEIDFSLVKKEIIKDCEFLIKILICKRCSPNGYGDRDLLVNSLNYIRSISNEKYNNSLILLTKANLWSDLLYLISDLDKEDRTIELVANLFANKLNEDIKLINSSTCCKSAPTENKKYDKKFNLATKICNKMNITHKNYRNILTKLRKRVNEDSQIRINSLSFVSNYQKINDIDIEYENIFNKLTNSYKENSFLNNSYLLVDSDIINISSISQRIIILMSILYSKSELPQKLLLHQSVIDESKKSFKHYLNKCEDLLCFNNLSINMILSCINKSSSNYLLISDKEPSNNNILFDFKNNSNVVYWQINESCIPHDEINLKRIKHENSNFNIKEMTLIENGLNLIVLSGSPLVIINILFNCDNYNSKNIIEKMMSLYLDD